MIPTQLKALTHLGDLSVQAFLTEYWQKKPVFIKQAFSDANHNSLPYLSADELAGYALEDCVESRLITEAPVQNRPFASDWTCKHGPMTEADFADIPTTNWTLLVQAVNQLNEDLHRFLHRFRFIPNWRLDDVMVSYATQGGSVGPHFDYYDVFLVQAQGSRLWKIGQHCDATTPLQAGAPLKLLTEFDETASYLAEPGDLLYVPPGVAHWGVAQDNCMTYSIGFRAPSRSEMLLDFAEYLCDIDSADQRFSDPDRRPAEHPGEITQADIEEARLHLLALVQNHEHFAHWFGQFVSEQRRADICFEPEQKGLRLAPHCTAAYIQTASNTATLYVNGENYDCSLNFAQQITAYKSIQLSQLQNGDLACANTLIEYEWLLGQA